MKITFRDRAHAGQLLAASLSDYADRHDVIVLGLPRGGVPVAFEVAKKLNAPLDVFVVRKLSIPEHPGLPMGAIATGGVLVLNDALINQLGLSRLTIDALALEERRELLRREKLYRGSDHPLSLSGKKVILVDDGLATGATMKAAIRAVIQHHPSRIIVAIPVANPSSCAEIEREADEVVTLFSPEYFIPIRECYEQFEQTTDAQVANILARARNGWGVPAMARTSH